MASIQDPPTAMSVFTLVELQAYAKQNFPEDFAKLPPLDNFAFEHELD